MKRERHPWGEVLWRCDPAMVRSLKDSFEIEFGCSMEQCPQHLVDQGWNFVRWYLAVHRDLPPGNRVIDGATGKVKDPRAGAWSRYLGRPGAG